MTLNEKIEYLQEKYFTKWCEIRLSIAEKTADEQPLFCVCNKLATGLHEMTCRKLQKLINKKTVEALQEFLPKSKDLK